MEVSQTSERVRTSGIAKSSATATLTAFKNGSVYYIDTQDYCPNARTSTIRDIYERYGRGIWPYKPCTHMRAEFTDSSAVPVNGQFNFDCVKGITFSGSTHILNALPPVALSQLRYSGDWQKLPGLSFLDVSPSWDVVEQEDLLKLQRKFSSRLPHLSQSTDLSVSLKEIKDVTRMHHFLAKKHKTLLTRSAEGLLSYQYGMKQVAKDLEGLIDGWTNVAYELQHVIDGVNKIHSTGSSVKRVLSDAESVVDGCPFASGGWPGAMYCGAGSTRIVSRDQYRIGAACKYKYHLPDFGNDIINDTVRALSMFHLLPDIRSLWDMIPYSFVCDWFINTDKFFDKWRNYSHPYDFQVDIVDMCATLKLEHVTDVFVTCPVYTGSSRKVYSESTSIFARDVGHNALYDRLPWFTWPSMYSLILGAALVFVRLPVSLRTVSLKKQIKRLYRRIGI